MGNCTSCTCRSRPQDEELEIGLDPSGLPLPRPPHCRKDAIFQVQDFAELDKRAREVPSEYLQGSLDDLVTYLIQDTQTELEKTRVLFIWLTSFCSGGFKPSSESRHARGTPEDYIVRMCADTGDQAKLLKTLCSKAGVLCAIVEGIKKSSEYQLGQPIDNGERFRLSGQWNAVCINSQWRLIDVYWACTCIEGKQQTDHWSLINIDGQMVEKDRKTPHGDRINALNEFFFLTDPDMFVTTHLPDEPKWQMLPRPVTLQQFESYFYLRERFFDLGMTLTAKSHRMGTLKTQNGEVTIAFGLSQEQDFVQSCEVEFKCLCFEAKMSDQSLPPRPLFQRYIFYQRKPKQVSYGFRFPISGKFKVDIFGKNSERHETLDLVASYVLECTVPKAQCEPYPDSPLIGWGPCIDTVKADLRNPSHKEATIETEDGLVEIEFQVDKGKDVLQRLLHNELEDWILRRHVLIIRENEKLKIRIRLPQPGEFCSNLFMDLGVGAGMYSNVCNYLIWGKNSNIANPPFPRVHGGQIGASFHAKKWHMAPQNYKNGYIETDKSEIALGFKCSQNINLMCEIHADDVSSDILRNHVDKAEVDGGTVFTVKLPKAGEYGVNIFAKVRGGTPNLYHVFSYFIQSIQRKCDVFESQARDRFGVEVHNIETNKEEIEIRVLLPKSGRPLLPELHRVEGLISIEENVVTICMEGNEQVLKLPLPQYGTYTLTLFEDGTDSTVEALYEYSIHHRESRPDDETDPDEERRKLEEAEQETRFGPYRENLRRAMALREIHQLEQAIAEYRQAGVPDSYDKGYLKRAEGTLKILHVSDMLTKAIQSRHVGTLETALKTARDEGFQRQLGWLYIKAKTMMEKMKGLETLRRDIKAMNNVTLAEIRSYTRPPEAVHLVLGVTLLILGESEEIFKDWQSIVVTIGRENLHKRVSEFSVDNLSIELALQAEKLLGDLDLEVVRDVSAGAAPFHVWSTNMIEECKTRFIEGGGDLDTVFIRNRRRSSVFPTREPTLIKPIMEPTLLEDYDSEEEN